MFDDVTIDLNVIATLQREPRGKASRRDWVLDEKGREWLYKHVSPGEAFAEFVGYALAGLIDLPVPQGGSVDVEGVWLSERIPGVSMWDPAAVAQLLNPTDLGRMLVLDAYLAVGDRHANNVLLQYISDNEARLWVIDYDGSGLRNPESMVGVKGAYPVQGHITGLPSAAREWAMDAQELLQHRLDDTVLHKLCGTASKRFPSVDTELAEHVLSTRLRDNRETVVAYLDRVLP